MELQTVIVLWNFCDQLLEKKRIFFAEVTENRWNVYLHSDENVLLMLLIVSLNNS